VNASLSENVGGEVRCLERRSTEQSNAKYRGRKTKKYRGRKTKKYRGRKTKKYRGNG
jgi:hypothetical protein